MDIDVTQIARLDPEDRLRMFFLERLERIAARRRAAADGGLTHSLRAFDRAICSTYEDLLALGAPDDHAEVMRLVRSYTRR